MRSSSLALALALATGCAAAGLSVIPPGAAAAGIGPGALSSSGTTAGSGTTATPILSVRRIPGWVAETVAAQRLAPVLSAILAEPGLGAAASTSCLDVSQGGRTLYADHSLESLIPASNMKLLTATALLDRLGPAHRMTTTVVASRPVAGVVTGNLYLVGGGDPLLATSPTATGLGPGQTLHTSLNQLASQVRAAGVTEVTGSVVGDESRYDQLRTVATWAPEYAAEGDVAPLSALEVNDGAPSLSPSGASAAALQAAVSVDPAARAAVTFADLLAADGVRILGPSSTGQAPAGVPVLTSIASPPLGEEVDAMLTVSDDTAAELFTKELGHDTTGAGTTTAGAAAIRADLAAHGLPVAQVTGLDGSGLDRSDRVTCNLIEADLEHVGITSGVARGLPVAGQTGTLSARMRATPAAGRLRAKTGTLEGVVALSGFVPPAAKPRSIPGSVLGQPVVFSLIFNQVPSMTAGRAVADQVGVALATYPRLPPVADIEPRR
jgi:D-alanyl-D-alanine carboxypeptidase/D-alanyl-D-alanine-endopeptidase (penicillin-binding protein 4)